MDETREIAAALRHIGRGFDMLARAIEARPVDDSTARHLAALGEWADRGLTRVQASALLRKHGFAPQLAGAWSRGGWIRVADDGLRYLTARSHDWVAEQAGRE
ncbi:hypothetical protein [Sphingomonas sp.]|uniref:hypothetical protein n=1 Tax=Sphingomonas sp. TaxID=28214 RepID=UPI003D6CD44D